jgi:hypothetical protein
VTQTPKAASTLAALLEPMVTFALSAKAHSATAQPMPALPPIITIRWPF